MFLFLFATDLLTIKGAAKPCHILIKTKDLPESLKQIEETVKDDLDASRKFNTAFSSDPYLYSVNIKFNSINANQCDVTVEIIDNATKTLKHTNHIIFKTSKKNWRTLSHSIADFVFEKIQGLKGHFSSKIAFIRRYHNENIKARLFICDYDGHNQRMLVESKETMIGIMFSHCGRYLAYRTLHSRKGQNVFIYDLKNNTKINLSATLKNKLGKEVFGKNISALSFGAHADEILFARSHKGSTTLHSYHLKTNQMTSLTPPQRYIIQTCPIKSHDGQILLFSADTLGRENVYFVKNGGYPRSLPMNETLDYSQPKICENIRSKNRIFFSGRGIGYSSIWYVDESTLQENNHEEMRPIPIVVMRRPYFIEKPCPTKNGEYVVYLQQNYHSHAVVMIDSKGNEIFKSGTESPFLSALGSNVTDIACH